MTTDTLPFLEPGRPVTGDWHVLPGWLPVSGLGSLPVNAFLLRGPEPMLVDTGLSALSEDILTALETLIDPTDLKWIWLSHTDADHIGSLDRVLSVAPNARVITNFLGARWECSGSAIPVACFCSNLVRCSKSEAASCTR